MSDTLVGSFLFYPEKLTTKEKKTLRDHLKKVKKVVRFDNENIWEELKNLDVQFESYPDFTEDGENLDPIKMIIEDIERATNAIKNIHGSLDNDTSFNGFTIKKRHINVCFSGELTGGEEANTPSYRLIRSLWNIGIGGMLYQICFD